MITPHHGGRWRLQCPTPLARLPRVCSRKARFSIPLPRVYSIDSSYHCMPRLAFLPLCRIHTVYVFFSPELRFVLLDFVVVSSHSETSRGAMSRLCCSDCSGRERACDANASHTSLVVFLVPDRPNSFPVASLPFPGPFVRVERGCFSLPFPPQLSSPLCLFLSLEAFRPAWRKHFVPERLPRRRPRNDAPSPIYPNLPAGHQFSMARWTFSHPPLFFSFVCVWAIRAGADRNASIGLVNFVPIRSLSSHAKRTSRRVCGAQSGRSNPASAQTSSDLLTPGTSSCRRLPRRHLRPLSCGRRDARGRLGIWLLFVACASEDDPSASHERTRGTFEPSRRIGSLGAADAPRLAPVESRQSMGSMKS